MAHQRHSDAHYYSITSSARAASEGGTVTLRALAVLRLITNSYLVFCWMGRSTGLRALVDLPPMRNRSAHVAQNVLPETANCTTTASKAGSAILTHRLVTQDRNSAISPSRPELGGELLGHRTLANKKMVNRVGRHECGVTLWQI